MDKGATVELRARFLHRDRRLRVESRAVALAPRDRPFWDRGDLVAERQLLVDALDFVLGAAGAAFADGYQVVCVGAASRFAPEPLTSVEAVTATIGRLDPADASTYPIVAWLVKREDDLPGSSADLRALDRNDEAVFFAAVGRGAIWVSVSDVFLDVIHRIDDGHLVRRWYDSARRTSTLAVVLDG